MEEQGFRVVARTKARATNWVFFTTDAMASDSFGNSLESVSSICGLWMEDNIENRSEECQKHALLNPTVLGLLVLVEANDRSATNPSLATAWHVACGVFLSNGRDYRPGR